MFGPGRCFALPLTCHLLLRVLDKLLYLLMLLLLLVLQQEVVTKDASLQYISLRCCGQLQRSQSLALSPSKAHLVRGQLGAAMLPQIAAEMSARVPGINACLSWCRADQAGCCGHQKGLEAQACHLHMCLLGSAST